MAQSHDLKLFAEVAQQVDHQSQPQLPGWLLQVRQELKNLTLAQSLMQYRNYQHRPALQSFDRYSHRLQNFDQVFSLALDLTAQLGI